MEFELPIKHTQSLKPFEFLYFYFVLPLLLLRGYVKGLDPSKLILIDYQCTFRYLLILLDISFSDNAGYPGSL